MLFMHKQLIFMHKQLIFMHEKQIFIHKQLLVMQKKKTDFFSLSLSQRSDRNRTSIAHETTSAYWPDPARRARARRAPWPACATRRTRPRGR